jgi:hypothetical protein
MAGPTFGVPQTLARTTIAPQGSNPGDMIYAYLTEVSGASGGDTENMNPAAALGTPSIYEVDVGIHWLLNRITLGLLGSNPTSVKFGNIGALTNGVKIEIVDANGATLQDFTGGRPPKRNADFNYLTGVDTVIELTVGLDFVRVRFTIARAGSDMLVVPGNKLRFTIQDDLSAIDEFRAMGQGFILR